MLTNLTRPRRNEMNIALAILVVVGFASTIDVLELPKHAQEVGRRNADCLAVLRDASLPDQDKEDKLQRHARRLFVLLGILVGGSVLALFLPLSTVWLLEQVGVGSFHSVLSVLQRLDFLAGTTVAGLLGYLLVRSLR